MDKLEKRQDTSLLGAFVHLWINRRGTTLRYVLRRGHRNDPSVFPRISRWQGGPHNCQETSLMLQSALPLSLLLVVATLAWLRPHPAKQRARHRCGARRPNG